MKSILLTCVIILIVFKISANDTIVYQREGLFEPALVENTFFYHSLRPPMRPYSHVVRKIGTESNLIPYRHVAGSPNDPNLAFNWHITTNTVYSYDVMTRSHIDRRMGLTVRIVYREFESRDSVKVSHEPPQRIIESKVNVMPVTVYFSEIRDAFKGHHENIENAINKFYDYLNFDIYFDGSDSFLNFYMRDKDAFYIWEAPLPEGRSWDTDWHLKRAYASPHYDPEFIPRTHNQFYDSTKTHHNAITDTLFFDGHFKVLEQGGEKYIVNREHAIIYHMGEKEITPIGRVLVTEDYPKIQGKPLFIEDRDHNRLIFFAPIKWADTDLPKPNTFYMKEEEMREYFKYVMD
ncbi:hypothetical protein [Natronoflexus pectinivorans]|uniref:Uncharacterized protein n=1 Tax=Natronoflexus pectinivorans TaxID=682526 RepID=A0A4R2GK02_9BACT|nr:hypothetical protein [Natronoflexus pectinivorans]TCO08784.1 hypothetical protein EV194_10495 [Natronoflexus pectinivorans]